MAYLKPQSPIKNGEDYIYPVTTADQIILSDGSRLEKNGVINSMLPTPTPTDIGKFVRVGSSGNYIIDTIIPAEEVGF